RRGGEGCRLCDRRGGGGGDPRTHHRTGELDRTSRNRRGRRGRRCSTLHHTDDRLSRAVTLAVLLLLDVDHINAGVRAGGGGRGHVHHTVVRRESGPLRPATADRRLE